MPKSSPREALTSCAEHVREVYGRDAADVIRNWRDQHYPETVQANHRWSRVSRRVDGVWVDRRCTRCEVVDQFGPLDGREVAHFVLPDGSKVQKKKYPTPQCIPLSAAALSTREETR